MRAHLPWHLFLIGLTFLVYGILFVAVPKDVFWSPDEGFRLIMARSLTTPASSQYPLVYPGAALDPEFRFFPNFYKPLLVPPSGADPRGSVQYPWPAGFPWLTGQLYRLLGPAGLYLLPWASGLLILFFCDRIARRFFPSGAMWVVPAIGLATPVLFYSLTYWDHTLAAALGMASLWLVTRPRPGLRLLPGLMRPWPGYGLAAGLALAAAAMLVRVEMAVWVAALLAGMGTAWLRRLGSSRRRFGGGSTRVPGGFWRRAAAAGLLVLAFGLAAAFIPRLVTFRHQVEIENFTGVLGSIGPLRSLVLVADRIVSNLPGLLISVRGEEGPALDPAWVWAGFGAVIAAAVAAWIKPWQPRLLVLALACLVMLGLGAVVIFMEPPFRSLHGVFLSAPFTLLAMLMFPLILDDRIVMQGKPVERESSGSDDLTGPASFTAAASTPGAGISTSAGALLIAAALFYLAGGVVVVLLLRGREHGGFWPGLEWGPRYLLMVYPLVGLLALWAIRRVWDAAHPAWVRKGLVALAALLIIQSALLQGRGLLMLFENKAALSAYQAYLLDHHPADPVVTDIWWLPVSLADYFTKSPMFFIATAGDELLWMRRAAGQGVTRFTYIDSEGQDLDWMSADAFQIIQTHRDFINGLYFTEYQLKNAGR